MKLHHRVISDGLFIEPKKFRSLHKFRSLLPVSEVILPTIVKHFDWLGTS